LPDEHARAIWFDAFVHTYVERGLQALSAITALPDFRRTMRAAALRLGQVLDQSDRARDVAEPQPTVRRLCAPEHRGRRRVPPRPGRLRHGQGALSRPSAAGGRRLEPAPRRRRAATVRYHGDFDWGGVAIARTLTSHVDWQPWRYDAASYLAALERHGEALPALSGTPQATPWDPRLAEAMQGRGLSVEEEVVIDALIKDLDGGVRR